MWREGPPKDDGATERSGVTQRPLHSVRRSYRELERKAELFCGHPGRASTGYASASVFNGVVLQVCSMMTV